MSRINRFSTMVLSIILIISISLMNVNIAFADDGSTPETTPTVEPTGAPTDSAVETPTPEVIPTTEESFVTVTEEGAIIEETPSAAETPAANEQVPTEEEAINTLLGQVPENTDIVVLDESGEEIPLASQEALDLILEMDPMWCPSGVLPGGLGCTTNFSSINNLLTNMRNNTSNYTQDGIIYFTANAGGAFSLTTAGSSLGTSDYNTLKGFNLILQGGWNGANGASATFTGQTNFGNNTLTIGTSSNPWVGNITLNNFTFSNVTSGNAVTIYTTNGDITLDNVDVSQQGGTNYTANLDSQSGDITVQNGSTFDGNNSGANQNRGFNAETNTGSITISDTNFSDARGCLFVFFGNCVLDALTNYNGATLNATSVTLSNVVSNNNDLNGIEISNANSIWLNNVISTNNGTSIVGPGVLVNGTGSTLVNINGGTFSNNDSFGVFVTGGTIGIQSPATCTGNVFTGYDGCYNIAPLVSDTTPPTLNLPANITTEATGQLGAVATYSASANDAVDGAVLVSCSPTSGSAFPIGTTSVNCSASDTVGNTANGSFSVTVQDTTDPTLTLPADITAEATSLGGAAVNYSVSATDIVDTSVSIVCNIPSGSTFAIGTTLVTCTATDDASNSAPGSFNVTVQDTTAPIIAPYSDITLKAVGKPWEQVKFSLTTSDAVDGTGTATCSPASGSTFLVGTTLVTCNATDTNGNQAIPVSFSIYITYNSTLTIPTTSFGGIIPITGGELIDLACLSVVNAFDIEITFYNLCEHQAVITEMDSNILPGQIPDGYSYIKGLNVTMLFDHQVVKNLPKDAGVQMDFPIPANSKEEYAVLFWQDKDYNSGGEWVEVTQLIQSNELDKIMSTDAKDEFYRIEPTEATKGLFQVLTTEKTGTFIIVKK